MDNSKPFEPVDGVSNEKSAIADMKLNRRARRALISCARRGVGELAMRGGSVVTSGNRG